MPLPNFMSGRGSSGGSAARRIAGWIVVGGSALAALLILLVMFSIMFAIIRGGWGKISWEFLSQPPAEMTNGGVFPAIVGTVALVLVMSVVGVPIGTITAVYLNEYAERGSIFTRLIRFAVNTLAGVPAIVFGLF